MRIPITANDLEGRVMTAEQDARIAKAQRALASLLDALESGDVHLEDLSADHVARLRAFLKTHGGTP
jgi:hypothetical protein